MGVFFCRRSPDGDELSESSVTLAGSLFRRYRSLRVCQGQPKKKEHRNGVFFAFGKALMRLELKIFSKLVVNAFVREILFNIVLTIEQFCINI